MKHLNGIDLNSQRATNAADPSAATDLTTKQYVDNMVRGIQWKAPVRAASTANINLAAPGATIDGVTMAVNDRFLAKDQTTSAEKGIYTWLGAAVAATRTVDADTSGELAPGTAVTVTEGTANGDKVFQIISDVTIVIGTTAQTWGQLGGGTTYTASNGVLLTGSNFTGVVAPSGGLTVGASGFAIDTSVVVRKVAANLGNGALTSIPMTHSLGTKDVTVEVREVSSDAVVIVDWVATDTNTVTFSFPSAPTTNQYRAVVHG